jgi:prepilin-type processing-associated H-X9-DG protein
VVIAIMGIVSSLVLPHAARLKARVKSVQCGQNLRQWGLATHLFIQDSDGWLPPDGSSNGRSTRAGWYIDLPPYVNLPPYSQWPWRTNSTQRPPQSAYLCPSNRRISDGVNLFHYTLNRHVNGSGAGLRVRLDQVRSPVQTIWLFDNGRKAAVASRSNLHTNLHLNGANILLLDGHVEHRDRGDYLDGETGEPKGRIGELIWEP